MHLGDSIFIFLLALVLLGPKRLPAAAKQLGKLMAEFRRASNDFKYQLNEELRTAEQQEQQKKQDAERAALEAKTALAAPSEPASIESSAATGEENSILPPPTHAPHTEPAAETANGEGVPYAISATTGEELPVEDHPLLRVDEIPPMDSAPSPNGATEHHPVEHQSPQHVEDGATLHND